MKRNSIFAIFIFLFWALPIAGWAQPTSGPVKVGVIIAQSGPLAAMGENLRMAYDFALKEINEAGGIKSMGGAKVEFVYGDHQADPKVAASEVERLIMREKVCAILGTFPSSVSYTATEVAERYKVPFFEPVAVMDQITERGFKYVFRLIHPASLWGKSQIDFIGDLKAKKNLPIQKIALIYENTDQGQATAKGWRKYAEPAGLKIILDEAYPRDQSDFTPLMLKIKQAKPDVILMVTYISDAILLQKSYKEHRIEPIAFIGSSSGHSDPSFQRQVGSLSEYLFDLTEWSADLKHTPLVKKTAEAYQVWNKDKRPMNGGAAYCYAGAWVLKDAMERAASGKPEAIRKALAETNIKEGPATILPFSPIQFNDKGQAQNTTVIMVQYRNGIRQTVWPEGVKALDPVVPFPKWDKR
jgi:branched-chain amino acid transport system substrate-binding protein